MTTQFLGLSGVVISSGSDDSQNRSNFGTNPSIRGESSSSSSSKAVGEVNQAPSTSCPSTLSTSGKGVRPTVPSKKIVSNKRTDAGVPKMRRSLDKRNAPVVKTRDEKLR
ncbi:hypothetical protein Adt_31692 [Abeliophyllum distichum]|uniref:Uncharacterized protein n=1 Tax=Abeliophyllum distichum TaxID=126358 RepID=A0ABD1RET3_9LAMI